MTDTHTPILKTATRLGVLGAIVGAVAIQAPEIRRYLKMRSM